jgi:hypothetical protein
MENKNLTAVEWLQSEWQKHDMDISARELWQQAKAMEKEQILNACQHFADYPFDENDIQQYYNETYNK